MATHVPAKVPLAGNIISVILQMITFGILAICLTRRIQYIIRWKTLPLATWLILVIYIDSTLFVFVTSIITRGIGVNQSQGVCDGGILLCLVCYMTTKILIYYFLVEKAYIIRGSRLPRFKTKLWIFNCFGMLLPYIIVVILNFIFRIAYINEDGVCIIGMEKIAMLPLISFDVVVNVYLTALFVVPLRRLYSYQHDTSHSLRRIAYRSFIGSCATLTSSVVNLTVLMVLLGEPSWVCLMCCNADILFSVLVLHWVTQIDRNTGVSSAQSQTNHTNTAGHNPNASAIDYKFSPTSPAFSTENPAPTAKGHSHHGSLQMWDGGMGINGPTKMLNGTMTTEIKAGGKGSDDDVMELRGIRVQMDRVQEVEIDDESSRPGSDRYDSKRSVNVENIV
ncbi:hypothetical protein P280DRAFT_450715 [Massarina eburnea CBS 473.64]|uniref:Integral membrane protein n=1 Tax=Massarina eburnea CBS 473.64 TaxID=1395130 RepID=A0A6A6S1R2_9PLEO|nr:hypothetical protein P280DRAFT_450715 [Massarina eburnea CBS 473.64]